MIIIYTTSISIALAIPLYLLLELVNGKDNSNTNLNPLFGILSYAILNLQSQKLIKSLMQIWDQAACDKEELIFYLLIYFATMTMASLVVYFISYHLSEKLIKIDNKVSRSMSLLALILIGTFTISGLVYFIQFSNLPYPEIMKGGY